MVGDIGRAADGLVFEMLSRGIGPVEGMSAPCRAILNAFGSSLVGLLPT